MARRKTLPESVRAKLELAERLATLRLELFGERGGPEMARRLGIPVRTWYNYEGGVTVPAEVVLKIIELTSADPSWLLHGKGPKFRHAFGDGPSEGGSAPSAAVGALLRAALQVLEGEASPEVGGVAARLLESERTQAQSKRREPPERGGDAPPRGSGPDGLVDDPRRRQTEAKREWLKARAEKRCVRIADDAMAPLIAPGSTIAYSKEVEAASALDGRMVVAWVDSEPEPVVRWFRAQEKRGLLEAENAGAASPRIVVELDAPTHPTKIRRVLWIEPIGEEAGD